jgi:4-alpha-glucanotransferase
MRQGARASRAPRQALRRLAHLYGVQTAYYDTSGRRQFASPESLLATLRLLGAPLAKLDEAPAAVRERHQALWQRKLEPVTVLWDDTPLFVELRLPAAQATGPVRCRLQTETDDVRQWDDHLDSLSTQQAVEVDGVCYVCKRLLLPSPLPWGYYRFTCTIATQEHTAWLICAPKRAYASQQMTPQHPQRQWGVFIPLYALHSERSWGAGDFTDLEALMAWVGSLHGGVIATLPLLSAFLDQPCEPSPYSPASRLFWNELYIDVTRAPGFDNCPAAQSLLAAADFQRAIQTLREAPLVDYRRHMALKRQALEALAEHFFAAPSQQQAAFQTYLDTHPAAADYACFRATGERLQAPWPAWPARLRDGILTPEDYEAHAQRYHLYVQWVAHTQLRSLAERGASAGVRLYLDLPLGVHPHSYDVWRQRDCFVPDATGGAPPDTVFTAGQNWGFAPLHPETIRHRGYDYFRAYLCHQLRHTGLLRIDHVMALHRLFWIPSGFEPRQGVYVRYAAEELYAIVCLESHRHQVDIVGENLGTVPSYVNAAMARHRLQRMYVVQYELNPKAPRVLSPVPTQAVASVNTHDMPPFAAYWQGLDLEDRRQRGLLDQDGLRREHRHLKHLRSALEQFFHDQGRLDETPASDASLLRACLAYLSASPARVVLVNLEDLWLETEPQNRPATGPERPNWLRKTRHSLDEIQHMPQVLAILRAVNRLRK